MKKKITIVGLGPGNPDDLTLGALNALKRGKTILRTQMHGVVPFYRKREYPFLPWTICMKALIPLKRPILPW